MADAVWPVGLPPPQTASLKKSPESRVVRSAVDAGPAKVRRRTTAGVIVWSISLRVTRAQLDTFESFFFDTVQAGALPFDWVDPGTGAAASFRVRGEYEASPLAPRTVSGTEYWTVAFELEQLPLQVATVVTTDDPYWIYHPVIGTDDPYGTGGGFALSQPIGAPRTGGGGGGGGGCSSGSAGDTEGGALPGYEGSSGCVGGDAGGSGALQGGHHPQFGFGGPTGL